MGVEDRNDINGSCCGESHAEGKGNACVPSLAADRESLTLFTEGDDLYDAMLVSIRSARQHIRLESYIFADDEIGWRFANALAERAHAGVTVRLHLDAAGSLFWISQRIKRYFQRHGVQVRWFHGWSWRRPWRYNCRNHRKLLVVDAREAYLGGFNIHRENSKTVYGEARWRDTHIQMQGTLAAQAAKLFDAFWNENRRWKAPQLTGASSVLISNHTHGCRRQMRCLYAELLDGAHQSLCLTTPYFVPDLRTQRVIIKAARRGVEVRLLVPQKNNHWLARWAAQASYAALLRAGVRVYEYLPRMLHAKTAVADGVFAIVGTANLDYRSFFVNLELNLFTRDTAVCPQLQDQFYKDLTEAEEIFSGKWARRHWSKHLSEAVGWIARRWL